jgi:hypothetical protein
MPSILVDEIVRLYNADPETAPSASLPITDSEAFKWMLELYVEYDDRLMKVFPSEALNNKSMVMSFRKVFDFDRLSKKKEDFKQLIRQYPYMMNICAKMSHSYYVSHQLEVRTC